MTLLNLLRGMITLFLSFPLLAIVEVEQKYFFIIDIILSILIGLEAAKLYVPFIKKTTNVILLSNVNKEMGIFYDCKNSLNSNLFHNNNEYNHSIILKYLNDYKVIFYKLITWVYCHRNIS